MVFNDYDILLYKPKLYEDLEFSTKIKHNTY